MSAIFVTATGTDIGKTFVTAALIRHLRGTGHAVHAIKPIVTGFEQAGWENSDPAVLLAALARPITLQEAEGISPWCFKAPLSPDMASRHEGRAIMLRAFSCGWSNSLSMVLIGEHGTPTSLSFSIQCWIVS
jgi:dethiobiotin synthetase